jgi:glucose-1-phosphate thymidylyltransferase
MKGPKMPRDRSTKRVFLSSTARDLPDFRQAAYTAIERLTGFHCVRMEDFTSQTQQPLRCLRELLPTCDLFIGLIGVCHGSCPPKSRRSFTEHEYATAKKLGLPCLMFMLPEDFKLEATIVRGDKNWSRQKAFRRRVNKDVIRAEFSTPDQLAFQVVAAIRNWEHHPAGRPQRRTKAVDCIILCGGYATRLWPLTTDISKVTLPVAGKPVLSYVLEFAQKSRFVRNVILSVNAKFAEQLSPFVKSARHHKIAPIRMVVEPESGPEGKLGPLGAIDFVASQVEERDFLVLGGDNLFAFDLEQFQRFASNWESSANAVYTFPTREDTSEYGVASLSSDGVFVDFAEKSPVATFKDVSTACYLFRRADLRRLRQYLSEGHDRDTLGHFLHWLTTAGYPPVGFRFTSPWFDVGTRDKLLAANRHYVMHAIHGENHGTRFRSPVLQHETSVVRESTIGPNVYLASQTEVLASEISNSIILDGAIIRSSRLNDSIVGPGSIVQGHVADLVCGRFSKVSHDLD